MPAPARPAALVGRVFRAQDVLADGVLTRDQLRSRAWRPLFRGVHADADLSDDHGLRLAGATLLMPPQAVFCGRSAAWPHGATEAVDAGTPVHVAVPPGVRFGPVSGMRVHQASVPPDEASVVLRRRCTDAVRTALDLGRWEPLAEAVALVDVLLARGALSPAALALGVTTLPGGRGDRRAERAAGLTDRRAESLLESRVRVWLACAGLVAVPQFEIRDDGGRFLARVDLAFPELRIAVEYDGAWHGQPGQLGRDRRRLNALVAAGWTVLHLTAADLHHPDEVVARVRELMAARIRERGL